MPLYISLVNLIKVNSVCKVSYKNYFVLSLIIFLGQITLDQDILDAMEREKLSDTNLFRTNTGRIKKSN